MSRSRGALTKTTVDRQFPDQVMLKNDAKLRKHLWAISEQAARLGASPLGHHFYFVEEGEYYSVYNEPSGDHKIEGIGIRKLTKRPYSIRSIMEL